MTTFIVLVLSLLVLHGLFLAFRNHGRHAATWRGTQYRHNFFRPDGYMGTTDYVDRDAQRMLGEMVAMSRRAPHN